MSLPNRIEVPVPVVSLADVKGRPIHMHLPPTGLVERRNLQRREALVRRIVNEFEELPGLILSLRQTMRLLGVDESACLRILDGLSRAGHIRRDARHLYVRCERIL
jgi:hypothetical protein